MFLPGPWLRLLSASSLSTYLIPWKINSGRGVKTMAFILSNIHKKFGDLYVLKDLNMRLEEHQLICILGPSGCGKTTLLNIISGVFPADQGTISGFEKKTISYLF